VAYSAHTPSHDAASAMPTAKSRLAMAARSPPARTARTRRTAIQASEASPSASTGMAWISWAGTYRKLGRIALRLKVTSPGRYPDLNGPP